MPGAPPLRLLSETTIRSTPSCKNEILEPTALSFSRVPAASGPLLYEPPSWIQVPALRLYNLSTGLPPFQK